VFASLSAAPLSTTFSGALAYGITSGHSHLANWRLLFLVEGLPTLCMVPVAYFFLPDTPDQAGFLTAEEKLVAKARGVRQVGGVERVGGIVWKDIGATLLDAKCWFTAFIYFSVSNSDVHRFNFVLETVAPKHIAENCSTRSHHDISPSRRQVTDP